MSPAAVVTSVLAAMLGAGLVVGGVLLMSPSLASGWLTGSEAQPAKTGDATLNAVALGLVDETLKDHPAAGAFWQWRAQLEFMNGAKSGDRTAFDKAFLMSSITAPREYNVLRQRAVFGIGVWPSLTAEQRYRVLADMVALFPRIQNLRTALDNAPVQTRREIALDLSGKFGVDDEQLRSLGIRRLAEGPQ